MRSMALALVLLAACGTDNTQYGGVLLDDGYIRYSASPVELMPGETAQFVQWVSPALDHDVDVVAVRGSQSLGGHHALLYASPDLEPVGTTRTWSAADQITARFLGGTGGEGASAVTELPDGAVLRVPAGSGFYIQTHYLNTSDEVLEGSSVVDVLLADPGADKTVLSMFVSSTLVVNVPPGDSTQTLDCDVQEDTQMILYFNHIHEMGASISTELRDTDGTLRMVKIDPTWEDEWSTRPNVDVMSLDNPLVLKTGSKLTTHCSWDNSSTRTLAFPDEMCAFFGFYVGTHDRACANGRWVDL
jgi:hypothetical protein